MLRFINMRTAGLFIFFLSAFISADEVPSLRYKVLASVYTHLNPGTAKAVALYDGNILYQKISDPNDYSKTVFYGQIENFKLSIKNLQTGHISDARSCKNFDTDLQGVSSPFIVHYENGSFKYIEVPKDDSDLVLDLKFRAINILTSYDILKENKPMKVKETFLSGSCDVNYKNIKLIPDKSGYIFHLDKVIDGKSCTHFNNNNLTLDDTCSCVSKNERKWQISSQVGGYFNFSSITAIMDQKKIVESSFKPWKDSSEIYHRLEVVNLQLIDLFHSPQSTNFDKNNMKRLDKLPESNSIDMHSIQSNGDNDLKKLYDATTCSNINEEHMHGRILLMAIQCKV